MKLSTFKAGVISAVAALGLLVGASAAHAVPFQTGDVFAGVGDGFIKVFRPDGTLVQTLDSGVRGTETTGMAFDGAGNLYATMFSSSVVVKFDNNGNLLGNFGSGFGNNHPESIVIDTTGNFYVGQADGTRDVKKFDGAGNSLGDFNVATGLRGSDWIDLAADQKTLFYSSEGSTIRTFDVSTNTQGPDFSNLLGRAFALRLQPGGGMLVANGVDVKRLDGSGNVVQTYTTPGSEFLFALNLDPDGTSFWTGGISTGEIYRFDIGTGNILTQFNSNILGSSMAGLAVFGEITVGGPPPGGGDPVIPEPSTIILFGSGLAGLGFWRWRNRQAL